MTINPTPSTEKPKLSLEQSIYNEDAIGYLLRRLNTICVDAVRSGDSEKAQIAASLSGAVERAIQFSEINV